MDIDKTINGARTLRDNLKSVNGDFDKYNTALAAKAQILEFIRVYIGHQSPFYAEAVVANESNAAGRFDQLVGILDGLIYYLESGLEMGISLERQAQIDVVSDFQEQAATLLNTKGVHPAAAAVLTGAALEEFLRNWIEAEVDSFDGKKNIQSYAQALRKEDMITKQDVKDITSWSGIRNDAAHGHWEAVADRNKIQIMLQGVNLFMRKYGPS